MRRPHKPATSPSLFPAEAHQQGVNYTRQLVIDGALLIQANPEHRLALHEIDSLIQQAQTEKRAIGQTTLPKMSSIIERLSTDNAKRLKLLPIHTLAHILCATQEQHLLAKHLFDDQPNVVIHAAGKEFYQTGFIRPLEADEIFDNTDKEVIRFQAMAYQITALTKDTVTLTDANKKEKIYTRTEFEARRRDIARIDTHCRSLHTHHHFVMPFEIMQRYINLMLQEKSHTPHSCPEFDDLKCGMLLLRQYQHPHSISKLPGNLEDYKATAAYLLKNIGTIGIKTTSCPDYAALIQLTKLQHLPTTIVSNRATPMTQLYEQLQKHLNAGQFEAHQDVQKMLTIERGALVNAITQRLETLSHDQLSANFTHHQCVSKNELADILADQQPSPRVTALQDKLSILNGLATPLKAIVCDTLPSYLFEIKMPLPAATSLTTHQPTLFQTRIPTHPASIYAQPRAA